MTEYKKTSRQLSDRALELLLKDVLEGVNLGRPRHRVPPQSHALPHCTSMRLQDLLGSRAESKLNS